MCLFLPAEDTLPTGLGLVVVHHFWALGWPWRLLDSVLAASIPVQAAPPERAPVTAHPSSSQKIREQCLLHPHKSPRCSSSHLAIPFYRSAPRSLPRETCCSPPRLGPWLRMYTQANLSTLFQERFGVNARQSLGSPVMKVCC